MSSLVRLGPGKSGGPLGITSHGVDHTMLTPDMRSVRFKAGHILRVGGQQDGSIIEDGEVPANSRCLIYLPTPLAPRKYEVILSYNPELLKYGTVSAPPMVSWREAQEMFIGFHAGKKVNLHEFDYIFDLYMVD